MKVCIELLKIARNGGRAAYGRDDLNIRANPPPHFSLKVVCKKGGRIFGSLQ